MANKFDSNNVKLHNAIVEFIRSTWSKDYAGDYALSITVGKETFNVSILDVDISLSDDGMSADLCLTVDNDYDDPSDIELLHDND